ncbi:MAG TPA: hypothetical protein PLX18_11720 [Anaerohalosphaeraceae bacterium]|nr:hypothetical protein [Anaerohalosphaeraceae bacterium]HQG06901.1 hypothetical protein [Anaerohalosphaeraceae bacterium]HQI08511.1 hypothetical protein [Anaerohalosphaeraceae bacterium]HQJ68869.1 hypothetical protein [Anaerohalosphaeraceae bacterium]
MTAKNIFWVITVVWMLGISTQAEMVISTAEGNGADTCVGNDSNRRPDRNFGGEGAMDIRWYTGVRAHIGYVRFDLSGVKGGDLTGARLQLDITTTQGSRNWDIYGLNDHDVDDIWNEMAITYNTAPGMLPAELGYYAIDETKLTKLGSMSITSQAGLHTSNPTFLNLDAFLGSDTNGLATLVLIGPADGSGKQYYAATKEGAASDPLRTAPALILPNARSEEPLVGQAVLPEPGGSATASATNVVLSWSPGQVEDPANPGQTIPDSSITGYYLYIANYDLVCDPGDTDFWAISPIYVPRGGGVRDRYPAAGAAGLSFGAAQAVYWRVDESIRGSGPTDPDTVRGSTWRFETEGTLPVCLYMENLGRGVAAVRKSSTSAFISWRLLALDPAGIGFNVYRSTAGGAAVKLNGSILTGGTCWTDTTADFTRDNIYYVKAVIDGVEKDASGLFKLAADTPVQPCIEVMLQGGSTDDIKFVWVGDLDGDGEYDFVVDRRTDGTRPQSIEAYLRDGTFLWSVNLGPNSQNVNNIEPGSSTIDVGHWDGVTVYDMDCDGRAEVMIRTANGVAFADGRQVVYPDGNVQFISVIDGMRGVERARIQIPTDYIADGPMGAQMGIGYLNGRTPSLIASMKNRIGSGSFNMMICAWDFDGSSLKQKWKWLRGSQNCADGHNLRIVDVDGDGMDEVCHIGFVLDNNGTLLYNLADSGIVHGDRWHIGKFDPDRAGLQGYGIQQDNPSGLHFCYYDAGTGEILWSYSGEVGDVGRGDAGDLDPHYRGFEVWAFDGVWNGPSGTQITASGQPWPCLRLWWDGDDLSEIFNDGKIEKWNYNAASVSRLASVWKFTTDAYQRSDGGLPKFYGDILGDWREEVILVNGDNTKLGIFTTDIPTSRRLYTLAHNPEYRNCMTIKGYMQSHHLDYYLGDGMSTPPTPAIQLAGAKFNPADIVEDGCVDLKDFAVLAAQWMSSGMLSADIAPSYGDSTVDCLDLHLLCENWLTVEAK